LELPLCPSTHITAHVVPRTDVPPVGCVMNTRSVPVDGGGVLVEFDTVTVREAVAERPSVSVTRKARVCDPLLTPVVLHA
jgi:hypothetical protein